jgi:hypothetical protein
MYEAQHVEEMEALARDPKLEVWYNLAQENQTPQNACLRDLSKVTCRAVARVLAQNSSLLSLDISRSDLGDEAGLHLAEMLKTNRRLLKLEVERNGFGPATIKAFGDALTFNNTLTFLSVENNPLTVSRSDDRQHDFTGVEHFAKTLESNSSLTSLNMFCTQMSMEGTLSVCFGVRRPSMLTLWCAVLTGGRALAKGLLANSNLIVMDVGNNNVGVKELEIITEKLEKNKNQREMSDRIRREQRKESQRVSKRVSPTPFEATVLTMLACFFVCRSPRRGASSTRRRARQRIRRSGTMTRQPSAKSRDKLTKRSSALRRRRGSRRNARPRRRRRKRLTGRLQRQLPRRVARRRRRRSERFFGLPKSRPWALPRSQR